LSHPLIQLSAAPSADQTQKGLGQPTGGCYLAIPATAPLEEGAIRVLELRSAAQ
jgi:hypothetical protein